LVCQEGIPVQPIFKEFGIKTDAAELKFSDLEDFTERFVTLRLSQLILFKKYLNEQINNSVERQAWSEDEPKINKRFLDSTFYRTNLFEFLASFETWLNEMSSNRRAFTPFRINSNLNSLINGKDVNSSWFNKLDFHTIDDKLSKISKDNKSGYSSSQVKIVKLFFEATELVLKSKYGIN